MKNLEICALMPHPPIMIPEVGKDELDKIKNTVAAATEAARRVKECNPQTIILITPHGPIFEDSASVSVHPRLKGNFASFGAPEISLGFETDGLLVRHILKKADRLGVNVVELTDDKAKDNYLRLELDHGALVPLYYLSKAGFKGQLIHISVGMLSYEEMYTFGKAVQGAIGMVDKRVAVIASGDLSHRLTPDAPAGYSPQASEFDKQVMEAVETLNIKALLQMDQKLVADAGECGLRPIFFLMGIVGGLKATGEILSYEGPFGVGYGVALINIHNETKGVK
ncbi:MAG: Extradiol ring-cleavage dioxygenase class protein subunit [Pelosinus sp.]|jgi:aromatic ring-opening dioxygenase LigB subunit|nr:Extradiol ring-cleavage dioxygenase class protein subunit [Pelosinus sp.]